MPNPNKTEIIIVLDRSGSMETIALDMIGGLNQFIADQAALPGDCRLTLVQFDNLSTDILYDNTPISDVKLVTLIPRGGTPLLDAIGTTIDRVGRRFAEWPETERPGRVVVMIITDGKENSSTQYTGERIREMVTHQHDVYKWEFTYLGANVDNFAEAGALGIAAAASVSYAPTAGSVQNVFTVASSNIGHYRLHGDTIRYTEDERDRINMNRPSTPSDAS